jgi:hypothetical protein
LSWTAASSPLLTTRRSSWAPVFSSAKLSCMAHWRCRDRSARETCRVLPLPTSFAGSRARLGCWASTASPLRSCRGRQASSDHPTWCQWLPKATRCELSGSGALAPRWIQWSEAKKADL